MIKQILFCCSLVFFSSIILAQTNRYPYIQAVTETTVVVAWRSSTAEASVLQYGTSPSNLNETMTDAAMKTEHFFLLTGLEANTTYYYQVTSNSFNPNQENFKTAPSDTQESFTFLHYGDCGYNNVVQNDMANLMRQQDMDFAVVAGDVDQGEGDAYDNIFFGVYSDMLAHSCHFTSIGNHDTYADDGATYLNDFYLPHNNPQNSERYYSFTWGNSKFIALDSNIPYTVGTDQHTWLIDEMACNDREWLFVFFHHPPWTNAWDALYYIPFQPYFQYEGNEDMRSDLVPYFEQYGVDYVLNGHSHCYQSGEMNGVKYLISGGAGATTLDFNTNSDAPNIDTEIYENHFVKFEVKGDTVIYQMINRNGDVADEDIFIKTHIPYSTTATVFSACGTGNNGSISLNIEGPNPPYTVLWDNNENSTTISNLGSGIYTAVITDARGCEKTENVTVGEAEGFTLTVEQTNATCDDTADGTATVTPSDGLAPFSYIWPNGQTTAVATGLTVGTHGLVVTDANGCQVVMNVSIESSTLALAASFSYEDAQLTVDFTTTTSNVTNYSWNFGDGNFSTMMNPSHTYLSEGTYMVVLTVTNACGSLDITETVVVETTGIKDVVENTFNVQVLPNPFKNHAVLQFNNPTNNEFELELIDATGKVVRTYHNLTGEQFIIKRKSLSAGIYLYRLFNETQSQIGKLIIES